MDLHQIVSGAVGAVNPFVPATIRFSTGYTTADDGAQIPTYDAPLAVSAQVQALSAGDIQHLDSLNIQGVRAAIYVFGRVEAIVRVDGKGGDLVTMHDGTVWLVAIVLERWPDWCKLAAVLQDGS